MTNENAVKGMSIKKKALIVLCALVSVVVIVATSVLATVAYLTAADSITNTFTVGDVGISLTEARTNEEGIPLQDGSRGDGNTYCLVPGTTYTKDPTIFIDAGSQDSYLFATVRNDISGIEAAGDTTIAKQLQNNGWAYLESVGAGDVYVYIGKAAAATNPSVDDSYAAFPAAPNAEGYVLFKNFTVSTNTTDADLEMHKLSKIIINAFAIQDSGTDTVGAAWDILVSKYEGKLDLAPRTGATTLPANNN